MITLYGRSTRVRLLKCFKTFDKLSFDMKTLLLYLPFALYVQFITLSHQLSLYSLHFKTKFPSLNTLTMKQMLATISVAQGIHSRELRLLSLKNTTTALGCLRQCVLAVLGQECLRDRTRKSKNTQKTSFVKIWEIQIEVPVPETKTELENLLFIFKGVTCLGFIQIV